MRDVLIVGCGDIGRRVARLAMEEGARVTGVVRSVEGVERLEKLGISPIIADLRDPAALKGLPTAGATVYYFAPPPGGGHTDPKVRNFCDSVEAGEEPETLIYVSTSGVYGDCGGEVVTEETPLNPQTTRAKRRVDAEETLRHWGAERGVKIVVLRVTGIYGPGRLPVARLQGGAPLLEKEESPLTNRIHSVDLARVCIAAAEKGEGGDVYNVSDGHPSTMTEFFLAVAELCGLPEPPLVGMEEAKKVMPPLMLSYLTESRRMDNRLMLEKLGIELLYPTLAEGLKASLEE